MNSKVFGLYLLLPASLSVFAGCAQTDGSSDTQGDAQGDAAEQVSEAKSPVVAGAWGAGVAIGGARGYGAASVAAYRGGFYAMYPGLRRGDVYMARYANGAWGNPWLVPNIRSGVAPALSVYGNSLAAVYPAYGTNALTMSLYNGANWTDGVGCGDNLISPYAPTLAYYNNNLFMAYRGVGAGGVYVSSYGRNGWASPYLLDGMYTRATPALSVFGNTLDMLWPGVNNQLYVRSFNGTAWGASLAVAGMYSPWTPGLSLYNNALYGVYGVNAGYGFNGYGLGWGAYDGNGWLPGGTIAGVTAAYRPALGLYGGRMNMVYAGLDNQYYWSMYR